MMTSELVLNEVKMFNRQKKWEREFQGETWACAKPRDKKGHGRKVLAMVKAFCLFVST